MFVQKDTIEWNPDTFALCVSDLFKLVQGEKFNFYITHAKQSVYYKAFYNETDNILLLGYYTSLDDAQGVCEDYLKGLDYVR